jgi:hypothetical protein
MPCRRRCAGVPREAVTTEIGSLAGKVNSIAISRRSSDADGESPAPEVETLPRDERVPCLMALTSTTTSWFRPVGPLRGMTDAEQAACRD